MGRHKQTAVRLPPPAPPPPDDDSDASSEASADDTCYVCARTDGARTMVLCDGCASGCHTHCMRPPRRAVPRGVWFCGACVALAARRGMRLRGVAELLDPDGPRRCGKCRKRAGGVGGARACRKCRCWFHRGCGAGAVKDGEELVCERCVGEGRPGAERGVRAGGENGALAKAAAAAAAAVSGLAAAVTPAGRARQASSGTIDSAKETPAAVAATAAAVISAAATKVAAAKAATPRKPVKQPIQMKHPKQATPKRPKKAQQSAGKTPKTNQRAADAKPAAESATSDGAVTNPARSVTRQLRAAGTAEARPAAVVGPVGRDAAGGGGEAAKRKRKTAKISVLSPRKRQRTTGDALPPPPLRSPMPVPDSSPIKAGRVLGDDSSDSAEPVADMDVEDARFHDAVDSLPATRAATDAGASTAAVAAAAAATPDGDRVGSGADCDVREQNRHAKYPAAVAGDGGAARGNIGKDSRAGKQNDKVASSTGCGAVLDESDADAMSDADYIAPLAKRSSPASARVAPAGKAAIVTPEFTEAGYSVKRSQEGSKSRKKNGAEGSRDAEAVEAADDVERVRDRLERTVDGRQDKVSDNAATKEGVPDAAALASAKAPVAPAAAPAKDAAVAAVPAKDPEKAAAGEPSSTPSAPVNAAVPARESSGSPLPSGRLSPLGILPPLPDVPNDADAEAEREAEKVETADTAAASPPVDGDGKAAMERRNATGGPQSAPTPASQVAAFSASSAAAGASAAAPSRGGRRRRTSAGAHVDMGVVPQNAMDPLFVPPGQVHNWHLLNVCPHKPFHSGLFIDLPNKPLFGGSFRLVYTRAGVVRAAAFARSRCERTEVLRQWWIENWKIFERVVNSGPPGTVTMPKEDDLTMLPRDGGSQ